MPIGRLGALLTAGAMLLSALQPSLRKAGLLSMGNWLDRKSFDLEKKGGGFPCGGEMASLSQKERKDSLFAL